ncbi:hypothetical protein ABH903_001762 [Brevibacterium epidermidis]|jgi:hypothetical protein|uniref:Uncharacterized protein n=1 Tax=Brevibacterium epidermidis TaxID=1698 RepID=A0ABV4EJM3_BREEP
MTAGRSREKISVPAGPIPRASIRPEPRSPPDPPPPSAPPTLIVWIFVSTGYYEVVGQADPDLEIAGIGGIITGEDEIEGLPRLGAIADDITDDLRNILGGEHGRVGRLDEDAVVRSHRHGRSQLLDRLGGTESERRDRPTGLGRGLDRELDGALLVRGHGVAEPGFVDPAAGGIKGDGTGDIGDAFDADEDVHGYLRMHSLSGSNSGVESTDATVTG